MFSLKKRPKLEEEKGLLRKQMALLSEKSHSVGLDARVLYGLLGRKFPKNENKKPPERGGSRGG